MKANGRVEIGCRLAIVAVIVFSGVFLPLVPWGTLGRFVNLFWGLVYGFGWFVAGFFTGSVRSLSAVIVGTLIWPIGLSIVLYVASGMIWRAPAHLHLVFATAMLLSLLCIMPLDRALKAPFNRLPLFTHTVFVVY